MRKIFLLCLLCPLVVSSQAAPLSDTFIEVAQSDDRKTVKKFLESTDILEEVASILLESAEKNFFIPRAESDHKGTFIYDKTPPPIKGEGITYNLFDPSIYGRGVLSVIRAFINADILKQVKTKNPGASPQDHIEKTNVIFREKIKTLDDDAATKIQAHVRGFMARNQLKNKKEDPHNPLAWTSITV